MSEAVAGPAIPEGCRRRIFRALVNAQDGRWSPQDSRREVALRYGINEDRVRQTEREGLDKKWPPL